MSYLKRNKSVVIVALLALLALSAGALAGKWETLSGMAYGGMFADASRTSGAIAVTNTAADYTLPSSPDHYQICAQGTTVFLLCNSSTPSGSLDHTAGNYWVSVPSGGCRGPYRIKESDCAHIAVATVTGATVEFLRFNKNL